MSQVDDAFLHQLVDSSSGPSARVASPTPTPASYRSLRHLSGGRLKLVAGVSVMVVAGLGWWWLSRTEPPTQVLAAASNGPTRERRASSGPTPARLTASWEPPRRSVDSTALGRARRAWHRAGRARFGGQLRAGGTPLIGKALLVTASAGATASEAGRVIGALRTNRDGRFHGAVALDRGTPTKLIAISWAAPGSDATTTARLQLQVVGRLRARLVSHVGARPVRVSGTTAPPQSAVELRVSMAKGLLAQPLATASSDKVGRWAATVRPPAGARVLVATLRADRRRGFLGGASRRLKLARP